MTPPSSFNMTNDDFVVNLPGDVPSWSHTQRTPRIGPDAVGWVQ
jgi:hypothetical protein